MLKFLRLVLSFLSSLKLTVTLLAISILLIYAGTWAQIDAGIWQVQERYFHSFFCWIDLKTLLPRGNPNESMLHMVLNYPVLAGIPGMPWSLSMPMIGGYTLGALLLINLLSAHIVRFKFVVMDLLLIPPLAVMIAALYVWTVNPIPWTFTLSGRTFHIPILMIIGVGSGVLLLLGLAFLHGRRAGVITIHLGLILLLVGEAASSMLQVESQMAIKEGSFANYSEDIREPELAIVERDTAVDKDTHIVISAARIKQGGVISDPRLPFDIKIDDYFPNSNFIEAARNPGHPIVSDRDGDFTIKGEPVFGGTGAKVDTPGAFITLSKGGKPLQSYLMRVSLPLQQIAFKQPTATGPVEKTYDLALRWRRYYKPFTLALNKFAFDRYTGTGIARNYSSNVNLNDPGHKETREGITISMNQPFRYRGETYYQSSFDRSETTTILQVVYNPGYLLPYIAILIAGFGLIDHFIMVLSAFLIRRSLTPMQVLIGHIIVLFAFGLAYAGYLILGYQGILIIAGLVMLFVIGLVVFHVLTRSDYEAKKAAKAAEIQFAKMTQSQRGKPVTTPRGTKQIEFAPEPQFLTVNFLLPLAILLVALIVVAFAAIPRGAATPAATSFSTLPVSFDGRIQPMDTLARNALKVMRGKETALLIEKKGTDTKTTYIDPVVWLLDLIADKPAVHDLKVFRIDHPDIKGLMGQDVREKYFSYNDLLPAMPKIVTQLDEIEKMKEADPKSLSDYQAALDELGGQVRLYRRLNTLDHWYVIPPRDNNDPDPKRRGEWASFGDLPMAGDERAKTLSDNGIAVLSMLATTPDGRLHPNEPAPARWLAEMLLTPDRAANDRVFLITSAELCKKLGLDPKQRWFSFTELLKNRDSLTNLLNDAMSGAKEKPTPYQMAVADLFEKINVYKRVREAGATKEITEQFPPSAKAFLSMVDAHREDNSAEFNRAVADYSKAVAPSAQRLPTEANPTKASFETWYNHFAPLSMSMWMYFVIFIFAALSWVGFSRPLARTAFWLLGLTVALHSFGLIARIYISGRPPVTNLASSAMFIGCGAAIFGLILELIFRRGIGSAAAALIAFPSLLIADRLSLSGDTMAVLVAVLDTNVWLATHVVTITLGYASTFLAGVLGTIYIIRGVFTKGEGSEQIHGGLAVAGAVTLSPLMGAAPLGAAAPTVNLKTLGKMIYGVTCFAIVCSFVGTILGGIWADQSWGRFWGWDPKENGAILIVLANAIVLHARWGGLAKDRGVANLAIFGNIVTAWSWFGTNMLGVGLHSYGFMASALTWLLIFVCTQVVLIGIGMIPKKYWKSEQNS